MSEGIVTRKGFTWAEVNNIINEAVNRNKVYEFRSETITSSRQWPVPYGVRNNQFEVRIFGGGGCGINSGSYTWGGRGGGGGWMNNAILTLTPGQNISISIGTGGNTTYRNGGTTSFGTYLSALGGDGAYLTNMRAGDGGSGGGGHCDGGRGYQFGGGGGGQYNGGDGGIWGGGGGGGNRGTRAGHGGTYGGGGGSQYYLGGNGGTYGGGGGSGADNNRSRIGIGGTYGGNGGCNRVNAENGTNTIGLPEDIPFRGAGLAGKLINDPNNRNGSQCGGGGGYGGNGGGINYFRGTTYWAGGGGGYGGNGGIGFGGVGGGGGYGGDGGSNMSSCGGGGYGTGATGGSSNDGRIAPGGGGGGYYSKGGNTSWFNDYDRTDDWASGSGGGGSYGEGGYYVSNTRYHAPGYGGDGGGCTVERVDSRSNGGYGGNGICIIQYWKEV